MIYKDDFSFYDVKWLVENSTDECNDFFQRGVICTNLGDIDTALLHCEKLLALGNRALRAKLMTFIGRYLRDKGLSNQKYDDLCEPATLNKEVKYVQISNDTTATKPRRSQAKSYKFIYLDVPKVDKRNKLKAILEYTKFIEQTLESNFNASGSGLHEKITSCRHKLNSQAIKEMRTIATIRNRTMHESAYHCEDFNNFTKLCHQVLCWLDQAIDN